MSLLQRAEKWTQQWMDEGREEGSRVATAKILKHHLQLRFGDLPTWATERIDRTDVDTLQHWAYRFLEAKSLEDALRVKEES